MEISIEQEAFMIAKFMGYTYESADSEPFQASLDLHRYSTNWNHLMPVVEKIGKIPLPEYETQQDTFWPRTFGMISEEGKPMFRFNCSPLFTGETLIEAAYEAVTDFIQWYKTQHP